MDFKFYFEDEDATYIIIKCYYTSNGMDAVLWQSEQLTYIDPETNDYTGIQDVRLSTSQNVYNLQGIKVGSMEQLKKLPKGSVAVVKVGDKTVKVLMK